MDDGRAQAGQPHPGTVREVLGAFLKLGLTSFGGPIAHLGFFRDEFVTRRRWLTDADYADLVALCQFLPGPASSQVGFAVGLMRAGLAGALTAFAAFTLPSALLMLGFALAAGQIGGPIGGGVIEGLKIVAVAIVAHAVLGMARTLCPDRARATIALAAVAIVAALPGAAGMVGAIVAGAMAGWVLGGAIPPAARGHLPVPVSRRAALACLAAFALLLALLPLAAGWGQGWAVADSFYRAGALVFGGGHVVLPLLEAEVVQSGWVTPESFLAGYGAAQAVPGPLFTFAAYLGASLGTAPSGVAGAALALAAIFLPGFLLLLGALPFWDAVRTRPDARAALQGANAAVVGLLGAALYSPVFTSAITGMGPFTLALACFVLLAAWKAPPWVAVIVAALGGIFLALVG